MKINNIIASALILSFFTIVVLALMVIEFHEQSEECVKVDFIVLMQDEPYEVWEIKGEKYLVYNDRIMGNCRHLTTCKWAL